MRTFIICFIIFLLVGCIYNDTFSGTSNELHTAILSGELIEGGDVIKIKTISGKNKTLMVKEITATEVIGEQETVLICSIETLSIERPRFWSIIFLAPEFFLVLLLPFLM